MLRRTLASMMVADYPHDTWLLDEGDHPDVRVLCRQLGVRHFSRSGIVEYNQASGRFLARTKAGNHNSWYAQYAGAVRHRGAGGHATSRCGEIS